MHDKEVVHFVLVSDRDMKTTRVGKYAKAIHVREGWLGALDGQRYFTSDPQMLYDPAKKPWFVFKIDWVEPGGAYGRYDNQTYTDKVATNGEEWTYVKQSLGGTRIPFTEEVKKQLNKSIEKMWRSI